MTPTPPKVSRPEIEKPKYCATPSTIEAIIRILIKRAISLTESLSALSLCSSRVEKIGWRMTRIRTFSKNPIYIPNSIFASIPIETPSRMTNRRINEVVGIRYVNPPKIFDSISLAAKPITMPPTPPKVSRPEIEKPKYCATPSTIEAIIGWRMTRIRTFSKNPIYIPNSIFASIPIETPSRMTNRRINGEYIAFS
jgi:hypothetical protein